jgi:hypothetical protein
MDVALKKRRGNWGLCYGDTLGGIKRYLNVQFHAQFISPRTCSMAQISLRNFFDSNNIAKKTNGPLVIYHLFCKIHQTMLTSSLNYFAKNFKLAVGKMHYAGCSYDVKKCESCQQMIHRSMKITPDGEELTEDESIDEEMPTLAEALKENDLKK